MLAVKGERLLFGRKAVLVVAGHIFHIALGLELLRVGYFQFLGERYFLGEPAEFHVELRVEDRSRLFGRRCVAHHFCTLQLIEGERSRDRAALGEVHVVEVPAVIEFGTEYKGLLSRIAVRQ